MGLSCVHGQLHSNTDWKTTASALVKLHLMAIKVMEGCGERRIWSEILEHTCVFATKLTSCLVYQTGNTNL